MFNKKKISLEVTLNGTSWVTAIQFSYDASFYEILAKVPTFTSAANVILGIFDIAHQTDGEERWNSGNVPENDTTDIGLDRIIVPGSILKIKADDTATEKVELSLYLTGV